MNMTYFYFFDDFRALHTWESIINRNSHVTFCLIIIIKDILEIYILQKMKTFEDFVAITDFSLNINEQNFVYQ